jgi:xanthine dehydrogenase accessory factor
MSEAILEALASARREHRSCAIATVAATKGSVPRATGAKMLVDETGAICGTIGGGKLESLVIEDCLASLRTKAVVLKTYPLHEHDAKSFGAICGGEVTVLIEPQSRGEALFLVGAGHCAHAIARLARECGLHVTVIDDRAELLNAFAEADEKIGGQAAPEFIAARDWQADEALLIVSRDFRIDEEALRAALQAPWIGYLGMMGSERKVRRVFEDLRTSGSDAAAFERVHAPIGLDIGADSPAEIAVSVVAEVLQVLRGRSGGPLRLAKR